MSLPYLLCSTEPPLQSTNFILKLKKLFTKKLGGHEPSIFAKFSQILRKKEDFAKTNSKRSSVLFTKIFDLRNNLSLIFS